MNLIQSALTLVVPAPTLESRDGRHIANFNALQVWAYPQLCKAHFEASMQGLSAASIKRQRKIADYYFGALFS